MSSAAGCLSWRHLRSIRPANHVRSDRSDMLFVASQRRGSIQPSEPIRNATRNLHRQFLLETGLSLSAGPNHLRKITRRSIDLETGKNDRPNPILIQNVSSRASSQSVLIFLIHYANSICVHTEWLILFSQYFFSIIFSSFILFIYYFIIIVAVAVAVVYTLCYKQHWLAHIRWSGLFLSNLLEQSNYLECYCADDQLW